MGNIFGDTDDITFGTHAPSVPSKSSPLSPSPSRPSQVRSASRSPGRSPYPPREKNILPSEKGAPFVPPTPLTLSETLINLVESMKPSYLPPTSLDILRIVALSPSTTYDPFIMLRSGDSTLLIGTGYGEKENAGISYPTLPDMRLPKSEKERLNGWLLLESGFDIQVFQIVLEMLGFPFVYGTRDVIAYIRDSIKNPVFLEKCRFFEILSPGGEVRKIGDFLLRDTPSGLALSLNGRSYVHGLHLSETSLSKEVPFLLTKTPLGYSLPHEGINFTQGEIIDISASKVTKNPLKFTFDTFYIDRSSISLIAGYALKDREELASSGVLTFVLEEDARARAIVGHIFIDSRGFVHSHEMMSVHKHILKGIRHIYESTVLENPRIERGDLVQILRRELTKYAYLITGRTPIVMPMIIER